MAEVGDLEKNFFLTFSLEEGEQYDFDIDIVSKIPDIDIEPKDLIFMPATCMMPQLLMIPFWL